MGMIELVAVTGRWKGAMVAVKIIEHSVRHQQQDRGLQRERGVLQHPAPQCGEHLISAAAAVSGAVLLLCFDACAFIFKHTEC